MIQSIAQDYTLLIFTDLDGSLVEHESYSLEPATAALETLKLRRIPVVMNSSKTSREIEKLQSQHQLPGPFICENGAALFNYEATPVEFGEQREKWLPKVHELRSNPATQFDGFADWSPKEIAKLTGLSSDQAEDAKQRQYSEPILWRGTAKAKTDLVSKLEKLNLQMLEGGRFLSIQSKFDKSHAMNYLIEKMQSANKQILTIALGDSPNDEAMLNNADIAVKIKSAKSATINCSGAKLVIETGQPGPKGWQEAIDEILSLHDSNQLLAHLTTK